LYSLIQYQLKNKNIYFVIKNEDFYLLIITSESSIIEQFSFEFILRRFDGDAPSNIIDTELVRLAVGVKVIGLIVVCC